MSVEFELELDVNRAWYNFEKTLQRLELLDGRLTVDVAHLSLFKTKFAPDAMPWESNFDVTDEESDSTQLDAIDEMNDFSIMIGFAIDLMRILKNERRT